ncbi:MurR/RpiR family transcriptional regulator [Streptomyces sp. NPDC006274]|uniref:MurR/RpiR family transcriptional regulator n=1 Tax=unclassified Streptomyces TaxID=2593676 RepID=UPI0033B5A443
MSTRLRRDMSRFSPGERRVARLLLNDPAIATDTVSLLARRAGVSAPTVVRFARRCGFAGYPALRDALRAEVSAHARQSAAGQSAAGQSAAGQTASFPPRAVPTSLGPCTGMDRAAALLTESTRETLASLPATELDAAVRLLGRPGHRVFLDGGRFTGIAARCLGLRLMRLRDGVHMVPDHPVPLASLTRDLRRTDVLVLFDHRPYEERTARIARQAKDSGARIVLFTDPWFSPVTEIADVVLAASVRSPVPRTSLVPTLALIETLVAVLADSGDHPPRAETNQVEQDALTQNCL